MGDDYVRGPIRAVILVFHGLGAGLKDEPATEELAWAEAGGLLIHPYCGPWTWMNRQTRRFVDELVGAIYKHYALEVETPLIATGGSMGGQGALLYTRYTSHSVAACLAMCPVCDLKYHFSERPDVPRTVHVAFRGYSEDMETLFAEHSPLRQVDQMPTVPYMVIHGDKDVAVSKAHHSDRLVAAMRQRGLQVEYLEVPGMGHGGPIPIHVYEKQIRFVNSRLDCDEGAG